ncbi:MAG: DegV family protein [Firmicutes bacterium]|nr:DegV family protein [Bacillota bacterium]
MNAGKIAILVDSGTDVPSDFSKEHNIFVAPLKIIYKDGEYDDRVNITPQEIYDRLEIEVPRTSLPDAGYVQGLFKRMTTEGYDTVLIITISSGLSGTHNLLRMQAEQYGKLSHHMVDTKNIGIGAGMQAMLAARLLENGSSLEEVLDKLKTSIKASKIYFVLDTLEYLAKGGRIGKVSALLGSILKLRPVISCNEEGVYETMAKTRGDAQARAEAISMVIAQALQCKRFAIAVTHGSAKEEAARVTEELKQKLSRCEEWVSTDVSPALSVHTGPGLIGIVVQALPV